MTPQYLKALSDSVEQVCCLPAGFAWDRKAVAHAEIVNLLADSAADPLLFLLVRNVPGHLYDLMVTVGPTADGIIASSRRRLLALIRARDADGAGREMEQHVEGLKSAAIRATAMAGLARHLVGAVDRPMADAASQPLRCPVMPPARRGRCRAERAGAPGGS